MSTITPMFSFREISTPDNQYMLVSLNRNNNSICLQHHSAYDEIEIISLAEEIESDLQKLLPHSLPKAPVTVTAVGTEDDVVRKPATFKCTVASENENGELIECQPHIHAMPSCHTLHPLVRILKAVLGIARMSLGLGIAISTGGTVLGAIGGSLLFLDGLNVFVGAILGKSLGDYIKERWPNSPVARHVGAVLDVLLKCLGVLGGALGGGLGNGINEMFDVTLTGIESALCACAPSLLDETIKIIEIFLRNRTKKNNEHNSNVIEIRDKIHLWDGCYAYLTLREDEDHNTLVSLEREMHSTSTSTFALPGKTAVYV